MAKHKKRHAGKAGHADISNKPGKATDPADHVAHDMKGLPTEKYQGSQLGTSPTPANMPNVYGMGGAEYPGQDIGA